MADVGAGSRFKAWVVGAGLSFDILNKVDRCLVRYTGQQKNHMGDQQSKSRPELQRNGFSVFLLYNNYPKLAKRLIFIWEKGTFSF